MAQGFFEMLSNSLTTPNYIKLSEQLKEAHNITMLNPLSNDLSVMRQSLLFSGLESVSYNINRKREDLKLFEFGKTYFQYDAAREEHKHLSLFVLGNKNKAYWNVPTQHSNFFYLKGTVTAVLERLGLTSYKVAPINNDMLSEGICLSLNDSKLVDLGLVNKKILKHFGISREVLYADFNWDNVINLAKHNDIKFKDIPKYPAVRRDFALLIADAVSFEQIDTIAMETEKQLLKEVDLFDVYQGKNLPAGKKSYAVSFIIQDEHKTLTDKQVDKIMNKLQSNFETQLGAELR